MVEKIKVKVFRYDPSKDEEPRYETYEVPRTKHMRVLDVLEYIRDVLGKGIAFRSSCGIRRCGTCGVLVDGVPKLACFEPAEDNMTIEPLPNFPIIRDLVIDRSSYDSRTRYMKLWLERAKPPTKFPEDLRPDKMIDALHNAQCIGCLLCAASCPALATDKVWLGPSVASDAHRFIADPRDSAKEKRLKSLSDDPWYCTQCNACDTVCPLDIHISQSVVKIREERVETGVIPRPVRDALLNTQRYSNPWGIPAEKQLQRVQFSNVRKLKAHEEVEFLLFVGCTCSSDFRAVEMVNSLAKVFNEGEMDFGILSEERCCGGPILRLGERGLFEMLRKENILSFENYHIQRIVTACPHGYDTFLNYYPTELEIRPSVQLISELIENHKLRLTKQVERVVSYHDPCFLGRRNSIYEQPRKILESIPGLTLVEFSRNRDNSFCCGGGGGRVWMEERAKDRPSLERVREALRMGVDTIATACPFCLINLEDATKALGHDSSIEVKDMAELVLEAI